MDENPEIRTSPNGYIMKAWLLLETLKRVTSEGRSSQEEGISPLQRNKEEKAKETESRKSSRSF